VLSVLWVDRVSRKVDIPPQAFSLERVPVQVPVIKEKPVIRVVYRERDRRAISKSSNRAKGSAGIDSTFATQTLHDNARPASFAGFQPLNEIKLTVIKGSSSNEE